MPFAPKIDPYPEIPPSIMLRASGLESLPPLESWLTQL